MHQDNHLIFEAYSKHLLKEYNPHQINSMFNNMTNSLASNANNLLNNPNLVPALQAVYGHRQQLNQGQQSISSPDESEVFRQYATALSGPELADPSRPENNLNRPHNKAMMDLFKYAQSVGIQPAQLAQIVRPSMSQAIQQSGIMSQMHGMNKDQIMQQVENDPKFLKILQNVFQQTQQKLQQQYGQRPAQTSSQQYGQQPQNVYNNYSWTQGLADLMRTAYPNGIPTE